MDDNQRFFLIGPTESILTKRGNRFPNMASYFVEEGKSVIYYTSNFYHAEKRFFSKEEIDDAKNTLHYELKVLKVFGYYSNISPRRVLSNFFFSIHVFFALLFKVSKSDKIILPSRPVELIFFIALLKIFRGVSIYLDIQDIWPDALEIQSKTKKRVFEIYCDFFLKPSLRYYTNSFYVAPSFKLWLSRYSKETPSSFVPLGWENVRWKNLNKKPSNPNFQLNIICVAQLQHQIDVMPILEVLVKNRNFHLTIVGEDGSGERYPEVQKFISAKGLTNVAIIGKVERAQMKKQLEAMDIGILPMITNSIPNKIFDYIAAELPIVVLGKNDSSNFVTQNDFGWSCDFNSKKLEVLLQQLDDFNIEQKRKNIRINKDKFSRDVLHEKIKHILS